MRQGNLPLSVRLTLVSAAGVCLGACGPEPSLLSGDCEIQIERLADLQGDQVNRAGLAARVGDRLFLVSNVDLATILVFDTNGVLLETLGGAGGGPGEFQRIMELVALPDGRLAAIDRVGQISFFDEDLAFQTSHRIPVSIVPHGAVPGASGTWFLTGMVQDRSRVGTIAVRVDSTGTPLAYYASEDLTPHPASRGSEVRLLAYHPSHGLVTMRTNVYAFELWNDSGALVDVVDPAPDWFEWPPSWVTEASGETPNRASVSGRSPMDAVLGIQFDDDGLLWVVSQVTPSDWQEGLDEQGRVADFTRWTDFVLQVYDLQQRVEVCAVRLTEDYYFGGFGGPGILKTYEEDSFGQPAVEVQQLTVHRAPGAENRP